MDAEDNYHINLVVINRTQPYNKLKVWTGNSCDGRHLEFSGVLE